VYDGRLFLLFFRTALALCQPVCLSDFHSHFSQRFRFVKIASRHLGEMRAVLTLFLVMGASSSPYTDWAKLSKESLSSIGDSLSSGMESFDRSMTDSLSSGMETFDRGIDGVFKGLQGLQHDVMSIDWKMPDMPDMPDMPQMPQMPKMPKISDLPEMPKMSDWGFPQITNFPGGLEVFVNDPFAILKKPKRPWWEGDNVCVDREVIDGQVIDGINIQAPANINTMMQVKSCEEGEGHYKCQEFAYVNGQQKTIKTIYSCCHGFKVNAKQICEETDIRPTEETLADLEGTDFLTLLSDEGLLEDLSNSTVFLPDNSAIEKFREDMEKLTVPSKNGFAYNVDDGLTYRKKREIVIEQQLEAKNILLNHLSSEIYNVKDFSNNQLISTKSGNMKLRMSVYHTHPIKLVMANCALITSKDHHTTTGVVHVVDRVIHPVSQTVGAMLTADSEFSTFLNALDKSEIDKLFDENSTLTVFIPTNEAFKNLDEHTRDKVLGAGACGSHILRSHILSSIVCSGAMQGRVQVTNDLGDKLIIHRADNGDVYVDKSRLVIRDMVATNGVIHVIDSIIMPTSAKNVVEKLEERNADRFLSLIEKSSLKERLNRMNNFTFFLPSNTAMQQISEETLASLESNPDHLEEVILHHFIPKQHHQLSRTTAERSVSGQVIHARLPKTVSCARVYRRPSSLCGGNMFTIDRLLLPPANNIMEVLANSKDHSHFHKLLVESGLSSEMEGAFTVFAPTDAAFKQLEAETAHKIFGDKQILKRVIKNHISPTVACCSTIPESQFPWRNLKWGAKAMNEETLFLHRSHNGRVYVNQATVERCDEVGKDGVMHSINSVLLPADLQIPRRRSFSFWKL